MTKEEVDRVMTRVAYRDWVLIWDTLDPGYLAFRWTFRAPDATRWDGNPVAYRGNVPDIQAGAWHTHPLGSLDEERLVRLVFKAVLDAEEHEAREFFRYDGRMPFNPHKAVVTA